MTSHPPPYDRIRARRDRFRSAIAERYDVVIVGAGTGGLCAAALLARRGKRTLLVDQHYVAGGNATVFRRPGYEHDIGLHYIGSCEHDGAIPRILRAAGVDDMRFARLGPPGDVFVLPSGERVDVPGDVAAFERLLCARYPERRRGIARYFKFVRTVDRLGHIAQRPWSALHIVPRSLGALRYFNATFAELLDRLVDGGAGRDGGARPGGDPRAAELRCLLGGWQIVYALAPSEVSAAVHVGSMMHYIQGAYYPLGGGQRISDRLAEEVERAGGEILLGVRARRIIVEDGRARGVVIAGRHHGERRVEADHVIAAGDIQRALLELVDEQALRHRTRARVAGYRWPPGLASVYLGVRRDLAAEGITSATYAIYPELDVEPAYAACAAGRLDQRPYVCASVPTLKDPQNPRLAPQGVCNVQLMSIAPSDPAAWGVSEAALADGSYRDDAEYKRRKARYGDMMIAVAEALLPGLSADIVFREMATPLTQRRYTASSTGTGYGIALTPDQFLFKRPPASTEIDGLVLAGASLRTMHGIVGALHSGVAAASAVLGENLGKAIFSSSGMLDPNSRSSAPAGVPR
ncbi:MAG: NAD(P)/FAD-dependent oxidoreductase [Myxococcales bacterium]|nr:NAD(P)/FAD-dependent oxidoreductase [Myxococcales bacterium]